MIASRRTSVIDANRWYAFRERQFERTCQTGSTARVSAGVRKKRTKGTIDSGTMTTASAMNSASLARELRHRRVGEGGADAAAPSAGRIERSTSAAPTPAVVAAGDLRLRAARSRATTLTI